MVATYIRLLAVFLLLVLGCACSADPLPVAKPLQGGAAETDMTGMMPVICTKICLKSLDELKTIEQQDSWSIVPDWMAGTWEIGDAKVDAMPFMYRGRGSLPKPFKYGAAEEEASFPYDFETIGCRKHLKLGIVRDRRGTIWDHVHLPRTSTCTESVPGYTVDTTVADEMLSPAAPNRYGQASLVIRTFKAPQTGEVLFTRQRNTVTLFDKVDDDTIQARSTTYTFDEVGSVWCRMMRSSFRLHRINAFDPAHDVEVAPLMASFRQYMQTHNMADLVP